VGLAQGMARRRPSFFTREVAAPSRERPFAERHATHRFRRPQTGTLRDP
jgi:hypothetical protein